MVLTAAEIEEWRQLDSDEALDELMSTAGSETTADYRVRELKSAVAGDRHVLEHFYNRASQVSEKEDPKLEALIEDVLKPILRDSRREARDEGDFRLKRKVLIFTYYADTVDWIFEYLQERFDNDDELRPYRGRLAAIAGDQSRLGIPRQEAVFRFAPQSTEAPPGYGDDFDVMVTTDVLAEGMNLQQCRNLVNFDLPWNPMRLVQRHGRIDRIGSPHADVYIQCFFPDAQLEGLLDLEARIRRKVAQAAATVGIEHEVIPGAATSERVFAETREEIEKLRAENPELFQTAGEASGTQSGEAYRQELRKGMERFGEQVTNLPWGAGSGMRGGREGHFFCARVGDRVFLRFVPKESQTAIRDLLTCMRAISCDERTARVLGPNAQQEAFHAWQIARRDIHDEWMFATDPINLQPRVRPSLRRAAEVVRRYPPQGVDRQTADSVAASLEAPWGARIENQIRGAMAEKSGRNASEEVANVVQQLGLKPFEAPEPLPPIDMDEVSLVCWMAIVK